MTIHDGKYLAGRILCNQINFPAGFYVGGENNPHYALALCLDGLTACGTGTPGNMHYCRISQGTAYILPPRITHHYLVARRANLMACGVQPLCNDTCYFSTAQLQNH